MRRRWKSSNAITCCAREGERRNERIGFGNLRGLDAANHGTLRPERAAARLAHGQGTQRGEIHRRGTAARQSGLMRIAQYEQTLHPALPQFGDTEIPDALAQGLLQGIGRT